MAELGPYQDPEIKAWFDSIASEEYWETTRRLVEDSVRKAKLERGEITE